MKNKNEPKTGLLAFSKANSIQYHFIEVMRCIFLVFKLKNSSQKPLKDKLQILHLNFKFKVMSYDILGPYNYLPVYPCHLIEMIKSK